MSSSADKFTAPGSERCFTGITHLRRAPAQASAAAALSFIAVALPIARNRLANRPSHAAHEALADATRVLAGCDPDSRRMNSTLSFGRSEILNTIKRIVDRHAT